LSKSGVTVRRSTATGTERSGGAYLFAMSPVRLHGGLCPSESWSPTLAALSAPTSPC